MKKTQAKSKEDMKTVSSHTNTTLFWGWFFIVIGSVFFLGFLFAAVISKLVPLSDNPILSAIQNDRYYCFLVPLTLPIALVSLMKRRMRGKPRVTELSMG
ncbi:hypothetical protein ACOSQ3_017287 [Xanthoceras sorbifolium]